MYWSSDVCASDLEQVDAAAVVFGDLARQRQAKAGAVALGRIKRQQRVGQHRFVHAAAAIKHIDAPVAGDVAQRQLDLLRRASRFVRVAQQVQQRLLNLRGVQARGAVRSEEHTSELQSLMRISYAVFCLKKKKR